MILAVPFANVTVSPTGNFPAATDVMAMEVDRAGSRS